MAARSPEPAKRWLLPQSAQRGGGGPMPRSGLLEHLDGGPDVRAGPHGLRHSPPVSTCRNSLIHMMARISNPSAKAGERQRTLLGPTWMAACTSRVSTNSQASTHHQDIGALGDQRERHDRVEQHRQLELVARGWRRAWRHPPATSTRPSARSGLPRWRSMVAMARARADGQQAVDDEGQQHLHEHRVEDGDLVHGTSRGPGPVAPMARRSVRRCAW